MSGEGMHMDNFAFIIDAVSFVHFVDVQKTCLIYSALLQFD
jgi:hypothetical protein